MSSPPARAAHAEPEPGDRLRLIIITGLSGAGKSWTIKCFEDMGYYCVDNLPTTLIPTFAELCAHSTRRIGRIALGVDIREREYLHSVVEVLGELRGAGYLTEVLFLEASEEALVRRYHETRRRHPVSSGSLLDGIREERKLLANLRELADRVIDTSQITVHELRQRLVETVRRGGPAGAERQPAVVRLQVRRALRGGPRLRLPVPAQSLLRRDAEGAGRAGGRRPAVRGRAARRAAS